MMTRRFQISSSNRVLNRTSVSLAMIVALASLGWCDVADLSGLKMTMPSWRLQTPEGGNITETDFDKCDVVVVAVLGTECPLAKLYSVELQELVDQFNEDHKSKDAESSRVGLVGAMSNRQDSLLEIASFIRRQSIEFPIGKDVGQKLADKLSATRTPEVFVFDQSRTLRYRGRVDDRYGIGYVRESPRREDLRLALQQILNQEPVVVPETEPTGCVIGRRKTPDTSSGISAVTYHDDVVPVLQRNCVSCHREGEIAPFALTSYDDVAGWADMMLETIDEGRMPPWHAGDRSTVSFANDRTMHSEDIQTLRDWIDAGTPEGTPTDTQFASVPSDSRKQSNWQLPRQPDYVFDLTDEAVTLPATGEIPYQYFRVKPRFQRDVWASAMQLRPGNPSVVHHILVFAVQPGRERDINAARGYLDGFVPGYRVTPFREGYAKRIPAGSELLFQVHYTPTGAPETDKSQFAIIEIDEKDVTHEVFTDSSLQTRLRIPAGASDHEVDAGGRSIPKGAELLAMMPHMHVRGKSFRYELHQHGGWFVGGQQRILLDVPQYDFNWQTAYVIDPPLLIDTKSSIQCRAVFDNSEANLNNPDPTATVHWG
ncbi:MAG: redoxin domain-containing protein, partial [Planctomycetota bacterium]